jgi:hypothetical protein
MTRVALEKIMDDSVPSDWMKEHLIRDFAKLLYDNRLRLSSVAQNALESFKSPLAAIPGPRCGEKY